jgi:hypothetical protein
VLAYHHGENSLVYYRMDLLSPARERGCKAGTRRRVPTRGGLVPEHILPRRSDQETQGRHRRAAEDRTN